MGIVENKTSIIKVKRSTPRDISKIIDFHKKNILVETPQYLYDALSAYVGISLVACQKEKVVGHLLMLPLCSSDSPNQKEAAIICGIWTINKDIAKRLIKEANMSAWESGYHVLFCLEKNDSLTKAGFKTISENYFLFDTSKFHPMAMELSWNGYSKISKKQYLPDLYLPKSNLINYFNQN